MKKFALDFLRRGASASCIGPFVLAIIYLILHSSGRMDTLDPTAAAAGIISLSVLAFIAGGMNAVYQIERLPLSAAILIHGSVLYAAYLATYIINGWLDDGWLPILVFTVIFAVGYPLIWAIIYAVVRRSTDKINKALASAEEQS